jgi:hypothetical protein
MISRSKKAIKKQNERIEQIHKEITLCVKEEQAAVPILEQAKAACSTMSAADISELKRLIHPSIPILPVLEATHALLDNSQRLASFVDIKRGFLSMSVHDCMLRLSDFDVREVKSEVLKLLETEIMIAGKWSIASTQKASAAAGALAQWVEAQVKVRKVWDLYLPKQIRIQELLAEAEQVVQSNNEHEGKTKSSEEFS